MICEIMKEDGTMARVPDLVEFSERHDVKMITVADLIRYRLKTESFVRRVGERILATEHGDFRIIGFQSILGNETHYALVKGDIGNGEDVLVRVHTQCLVGDVFGSVTCHCHQQMDRALEIIASEGRGVLLYLAQMSKAGQTNLPPEIETHGKKGIDANETIAFRGEQREYGIGAQILASLNIHSMRILSNHPRKLIALKAYGLRSSRRFRLHTSKQGINRAYNQSELLVVVTWLTARVVPSSAEEGWGMTRPNPSQRGITRRSTVSFDASRRRTVRPCCSNCRMMFSTGSPLTQLKALYTPGTTSFRANRPLWSESVMG